MHRITKSLSMLLLLILSNCTSVTEHKSLETTPPPNNCLEFAINLDKDSYSSKENFDLTMKLLNNGRGCAYIINRRLALWDEAIQEGEVKIFFTSYPSGNQETWPAIQDRMVTLSDRYFMLLLNNEAFMETVSIPYPIGQFCKEERCYLQAIYGNQADNINREIWGDYQVWKGEIASNVVFITVKQR